jgi:hypothetical protein
MSRGLARRATPRGTRLGVLLSAALALALAAGTVWHGAYAGFTDRSSALSASVTTGRVALANSVSAVGAALTLGEVKPGESATQCIVVTSTGSTPATVRLYSTGRSTTKNVSASITLLWEAGTGGGAYGDCTGFTVTGGTQTSTLAAFPATYGTGVLPWATTGTAGETRTYRLTYSVPPNAPTSTKGGSATVTFVWEAQQ